MVAAAARALALRTPLAPFRRFRRALRVRPCEGLVGLGSEYGGWTVPVGRIGPGSIVYSGGIGLDASFDLELIARTGCEVHGFDPTPSTADYVRADLAHEQRFHFHPWGVAASDEVVRFYAPDYSDTNFSAVNLHGTSDYFEAPCRSVPSLMAELGHDRLDLLKLDIEGSEYAVLDALGASGVRPGMLCVEFHKTHGVQGAIAAATVVRGWGYDAVAVDGYDVTFVRRDGPTPR